METHYYISLGLYRGRPRYVVFTWDLSWQREPVAYSREQAKTICEYIEDVYPKLANKIELIAVKDGEVLK